MKKAENVGNTGFNRYTFILLVLSVYFQSVINIYDKYVDYIDHEKYDCFLKSLEKTKHVSGESVDNNKNSKFSENSYIPKQAQFVRSFLKEHPIDSYRLSPLIIGAFNRYAILEGAYPIKVSANSNYLITTSNDVIPQKCSVLDSKEGVQIVYCP